MLELRGVSKAFGATRALSNVSLSVRASEVHVLAGENGAGKSTLIRILSGVYQDYAGELRLAGRPVRFANPAAARAAGVATIHQELSLIPALSIADNVLLAQGGATLAPLKRTRARAAAQALLARVGLELDVDRRVETLSLSERQLLEIARCLGERARVFIMDEPTSALSEPEARRLFALIARIVEDGASVIYISHRMDEIYRIGQRISVLRDGELVLSAELARLSERELVSAMVGGALLSRDPAASAAASSAALLRVSELGRRGTPGFTGLSFELAPGEILGLAGLRDSGASQVLPLLVGAEPPLQGALQLEGKDYVASSPELALRRGLAFVPADRNCSIFAELSVSENATLTSLARFSRWGWVQRAREREALEQRRREVKLKAPSFDAPASALSGGNQQKLALLRALLSGAKVLLLDDPTRGVDIAAKADIHELLRSLAREGFALLLHSTDLDELTALCSRVMVLFRGQLRRTLSGPTLTRDALLGAMMGAAE